MDVSKGETSQHTSSEKKRKEILPKDTGICMSIKLTLTPDGRQVLFHGRDSSRKWSGGGEMSIRPGGGMKWRKDKRWWARRRKD